MLISPGRMSLFSRRSSSFLEEGPDYSLLEEDHKKDDSDDVILTVEKQTPRHSRQSRQPRSRLPPRTPRPSSPRPQPRTPRPSSPLPLPQTPPSSPPPPPPSSQPPSFPKNPKDPDSTDLVTLKRFLNANKRKPDAVILTPKSKFFNWDKKMAEAAVEEIYQKRKEKVADDLEKRKPGYFH